MNNPETVSESFIKWLEDNNVAAFGSDLYLSQVPLDAPNRCYWVLTNGGSPISSNRTGEKVKQYFVSVYHRSTKAKEVERNLFALENLINSPGCLQLEGFEVIEIEASTYPTDVDLDNEQLRVGMLQVNIQIYKKD